MWYLQFWRRGSFCSLVLEVMADSGRVGVHGSPKGGCQAHVLVQLLELRRRLGRALEGIHKHLVLLQQSCSCWFN